jgi:hypothetical protein
MNPPVDSADAEPVGLSDATVAGLLAAEDAESIERLAVWLKKHATTFAPIVVQAAHKKAGLSGEASCAVLDALMSKAPADEETTLGIMSDCLRVIAGRITKSLRDDTREARTRHDDPLVGVAVAVVTAGRRSSLSETAVSCLAKAGPGGTLVLARAFDTLRDSLKLYAIRRLKPAVIWELGDNVVASLGNSVSKLAEELEGRESKAALKFLAELAPEEHSKSSEISPTDPLKVGDSVFHASWGVGTVVKIGHETLTVDFGSSGTRTLLRALATLRHAA